MLVRRLKINLFLKSSLRTIDKEIKNNPQLLSNQNKTIYSEINVLSVT